MSPYRNESLDEIWKLSLESLQCVKLKGQTLELHMYVHMHSCNSATFLHIVYNVFVQDYFKDIIVRWQIK